MESQGAASRAGVTERGALVSGVEARHPDGYPMELVREMAWYDGAVLLVRPIRPDDGARLVAFHHRLSTKSTYLRFFSVHPELSAEEVSHFTCVDYVDRLALVVECEGELVAVGRYDRVPGSSEAEVAFVVADELQRHGIGTLLLGALAAAARRRGITVFTAMTLAENQCMLDVFRHSGFQVTSQRDHETVNLRFSICPDDHEPAPLAHWSA